MLIDAWSKIAGHPSVRGWKVEIVGDGPERATIEAEIQRCGLADSVHVRGAVMNAAKLLSEFEIFVLPSLREGLPLVLMEAMAAECAVVATSLPGCQEVLGDDGALLVPPRNAHALADAMLNLIGDPELRRSVAAAGHRRFVNDFTRARMLNDYGGELGIRLSDNMPP
jgi:glycosyltransferase involved in cell wall biosynthesis